MAGQTRDDVLEALRGLFLADVAAGTVRPLHRYQQLFPGYFDDIAQEVRRLREESGSGAEGRAGERRLACVLHGGMGFGVSRCRAGGPD